MSEAGQRLAQRQGQTLVMTPQLRRSLQLLEMSSLALRDLIERELDQNPMLERADADDDDQGGGATRKSTHRKPAPSLFRRDIDRLGLWPGGPRDSGSRSDTDAQTRKRDRNGSTERAPEANGSAPADLTAHLLEQINIDLTDPMDRMIAMLLLEQLDESGYLTGDIEQTRRRAGCSAARLEAMLTRLRQFDPPGLFARNLSECLAPQLRERGRLTAVMAKLLEHLDLLAKGDRQRLMALCGVDTDELSRMIAEIRTLDPRPASSFNAAAAVIVPDVVVRPGADGGWLVEAQSEHWPRLLVKKGYVARMRGTARDKATRDYITEKLAAANWLLRSLQRREETIVKVATAIVHHQDGFLRDGVARLRASTRRELAKSIGLHESTVSRVSANKFMATPRGTYPFGFFFGGALAAGATSPGHAAAAVRTRISAVIEGESHDSVLSDRQIVRLLRAEGIRIARRTVAKYRKSLRIPASAGRRRRRRLQGS